jgi:hypothetical protein
MHHHRGGNTQPNNQSNKQLVSIKLGTLLSSQTTTTPNQHTRINKQSMAISTGATSQTYLICFLKANQTTSFVYFEIDYQPANKHTSLHLFSRAMMWSGPMPSCSPGGVLTLTPAGRKSQTTGRC